MSPTSNCAFEVVEKITMAKGTGELKRLSKRPHDITATGTVSFCPGDNRNTFELAGTVCFKE